MLQRLFTCTFNLFPHIIWNIDLKMHIGFLHPKTSFWKLHQKTSNHILPLIPSKVRRKMLKTFNYSPVQRSAPAVHLPSHVEFSMKHRRQEQSAYVDRAANIITYCSIEVIEAVTGHIAATCGFFESLRFDCNHITLNHALAFN